MATPFYQGGVIGRDVTVNMFDQLDRGYERADAMRARQNQVNYEAALQQYGAAAYNGDTEAQKILAQFDPEGMREVRIADEDRAAQRVAEETASQERMRVAREAEMAKLSEQERANAEAELGRLGLGAIGTGAFVSEEAFDAFVVQNGGDPGMINREDAIFLLPSDLQKQAIEQMQGTTGEIDPVTGKPKVMAPPVPGPATTATPTIPTQEGSLFDRPRLSFGSRFGYEDTQTEVTPTPVEAAPAAITPPVTAPKGWEFRPFIYDENGKKVEPNAGMVFGRRSPTDAFIELPNPESIKTKQYYDDLENKFAMSNEQISKIDNVLSASDEDLEAVLGWFEGGLVPDVIRSPERQALADSIDSIIDNTFLMAGESIKGTLTETDAAKATSAIANMSRSSDPAAVRDSLAALRRIIASANATASEELNVNTERLTGKSNAYLPPPANEELIPLGEVVNMNITNGKVRLSALTDNERRALTAYRKSIKRN
jgi:hypothetical protein